MEKSKKCTCIKLEDIKVSYEEIKPPKKNRAQMRYEETLTTAFRFGLP